MTKFKAGDRVRCTYGNWVGVTGVIKDLSKEGNVETASFIPDKDCLMKDGTPIKESYQKHGARFFIGNLVLDTKKPNKEDYAGLPNYGVF